MRNFKDIIKKNWIMFLLIIVIITTIPILINSFILENGVRSAASNDAWASFFGSYFGGTFGGLLTLAGVWWTIYENRKKDIEREKPILALIKNFDIRGSEKEENKFVYAHLAQNGNITRLENMVLKNIGTQAVQYSEIIIGNNPKPYVQNSPILKGEEYHVPELIYQEPIGENIRIEIIYYDFYNKKYSTIIDCNVDREKLGSAIELIYIPEINTKLK